MGKKKNRKQYKQKVTTDKRVDMRTGGRVKAQRGGLRTTEARGPNLQVNLKPTPPKSVGRPVQKPITTPDPNPPVTGGPVGPGVPFDNTSNPPAGNPIGAPISDGNVFVPGEQSDTSGEGSANVTNTNQGQTDPNREDRIVRTGERAEEISQGNVGDIPQIPIPATIGRDRTDIAIGTGRMEGEVEDARQQQIGVGRERVTTDDAAEATMDVTTPVREAEIERARDVDVTAEQTTARGVGPAPQQTLTDERDAAQISSIEAEVGKAKTIDAALSAGAFAPQVTGSGSQVSATSDAERQTRESIVDSNAVGRQAAEIIGTVGYEAAKRRTVTGEAAKGAAANVIAETANIPETIAAAIVEDPATVEAQIANEDVEVQAAVAALPTEALVSSQMETLLGGMEDGNIPLWAKPAVDAVNQNMAARGMLPSTVGRDALFNAIVQSAFPIAQSNAQALQTRAAQNLSNEQAANLQEATQEQQLRLQNLANRQTAESQTAQNAQQMRGMQSQFRQQAVMTTAQQQQQTRLQNLQNEQQAAVLRAQNQQAINLQELGNQQQINLAELQIEAQAAGADQSSENQERLAEMQVAADFMARNAAFKQDMDKANLSEETKIRLANLTALNQAESQQLTVNQQTELANLNKRMQLNIRNADLAQQLGIAQLNVDQQTAMQRATVQANMDMTKFNTAQQVELANSKFMQTVTLENMNAEQQSIMQEATALAQLDVANLGVRERLQVENAKNFLSYDMANLDNAQQASVMRAQLEQQRILSDQAAFNAAQQFNATNENQMNQFMTNLGAQMEQYNTSQINAMKQFNLQNLNAAEARRVGNELQAETVEAQLGLEADKFNSAQEFARDQFNSQQEMVVAQSNVEWRRKANTADTAAFNAVNQQNAQNAFNLTASANNFLWQEIRDEADFDFKRWDNDQQRKASLLIAALGNEQGVNRKDHWDSNLSSIASLLEGWLD